MSEEQLPGVGRIAEQDDIAPEGEVVTAEHVRNYQASVEKTHRELGLPTDKLWGK